MREIEIEDAEKTKESEKPEEKEEEEERPLSEGELEQIDLPKV